jgi:hypothetical protein
MAEDYNIELQKLYVEFLMSDNDLFVRCNNILSEKYFDRSLSPTVKFLRNYVGEYGSLPSLVQIKAKTGVELEDRQSIGEEHRAWFLDDFEKFCRHKALAGAILASTDHLNKQEFGAVEQLIKDAVAIGLAKELGTNYWENPKPRLQRILERKGGTSTGWKSVDKVLYGGFNRGELAIFAGGSGAGKSLVLQNLALNWASLGFNVVYISLELSEDLCSLRLDSMLSGMSSQDVFRNIDDVSLKVVMQGKKHGAIQIVQMQNGIDVNAIRAYIREYQIQHNLKVDAVLVDYLDLMSPAAQKVSGDNVFLKDKLVSEELRNLSVEGDYLFATASQLNRQSVDETDFDHSHISGGLSKIMTADNVIGIFSSKAMRERGIMQIQFMKTRSSNGVGMKVDLELNIDSLRISDLADDATVTSDASVMYTKLKSSPAATDNTTQTSSAIDNAARLKDILNKRKT